MATTLSIRSAHAEGDPCVTLRGIRWEGYKTTLRLRGERCAPRMIYLDGDLLLVSPSFAHERLKKRMGMFIVEVVAGLDIPCVPAGSPTFRRRKKKGGVEPDESFYLANEARVRGKDKISLRVDPPPDLALEAVYSHDAEAALEVFRRFGVPEVWVCETDFQILALQGNGRYAESATSPALPFLKASEIAAWLHRPQAASETKWVREVRDWVRTTLAPRVRGERAEENP